MTLVSAGWAVTGPKVSGDYMAAIKAGRIGAISNLWGPARDARGAAGRGRGDAARHAAAVRLRRDPRPPHHLSDPAGRGGGVRSGPVGADGARRRRRGRCRRAGASPSPRCWMWRAIRAGAGSPRARARTPGSPSRYAEAKVRGFQGEDIGQADSLAATAKHLAGYGAATAGRDYASVDLSERSFQEVYLPPFRAAVDAGVAAIMPAFHDLAGVPMTANAAVLHDLVRGRWGFDGVMVSDHGAVAELVAHGVAEDLAEAAALALRAGVDIDLMGGAYAAGSAARARTRPRDHGADRCRGPARARAQGAARPARRSVPPQQGRAGAGGSARGAAAAGARRRAPLDRASDQPRRACCRCADGARHRRDRTAGGCPRRHAGTVGGRGPRRGHGDDPRRAARRAPGQRDRARARGRDRSRGAERYRRRARRWPAAPTSWSCAWAKPAA